MNTLEYRIRAAITAMGFMWGNTTDLKINKIIPLSVQGEMGHAELEYQHIRIPVLYVDSGTLVDLFMSPSHIMYMFIEPRLEQHDYEHPFLLGA